MSNNAKIAGILAIVAGACGVLRALLMVLVILIFRFAFTESYYIYPNPARFFTFITIIYAVIGFFLLLVSVLGIVGGVFALQKKNWGLALAGAIAGVITFFPCGIPAVIFISMAKPEFSTPIPPPPAEPPAPQQI
jgi:hypothetical protein